MLGERRRKMLGLESVDRESEAARYWLLESDVVELIELGQYKRAREFFLRLRFRDRALLRQYILRRTKVLDS